MWHLEQFLKFESSFTVSDGSTHGVTVLIVHLIKFTIVNGWNVN